MKQAAHLIELESIKSYSNGRHLFSPYIFLCFLFSLKNCNLMKFALMFGDIFSPTCDNASVPGSH